MDLRLLGPVEARLGGRALPLGPPKQRAVLAMLARAPGHTVSVDELASGLWGEQPPASAAKMVQLYVSHLRRAIDGNGAAIVTRGRGYALELDGDRVDSVRFERLIEEGRAREALALWNDDPLSDMRDEPFAAAEIRRLEDLRARALEAAIDAEIAAGRHREALARIDALVAEHPLRERPHAQRMLALYRAGRQADALAAYRQARATLVEEIGVEPGPELRRLHEAILAQDPALELRVAEPAPAGGPPLERLDRRRVPVVALLAVALLAAGLVAFGISRVAGGDRSVRIHENAVALLDPGNGAVRRQLPVGRAPTAIAVGAGSAWIASAQDGTISRVDRDGGEVVKIPVDGSPEALAFGNRSLWVADGDARRVLQVDPGSNRVVSQIAVGNTPRALAVTDGALWVASGLEGTVDRIDLDRGRVVRKLRLGTNATALAAGAGAVWAASEEAGTVTRIEPASNTVREGFHVGNGPSAIAVGERAVWVINRTDGTLARIDPSRNAVRGLVSVGTDPVAVAAGAGQVWVAGGAEEVMVRVAPDEQLRVVKRIRTGSSPSAVAIAGDDIWAAGAAPPAAHRGGTLRVELAAAGRDAVQIDWLAPAGYLWTTSHLGSLIYDTLVSYPRTGGVARGTLVGALATGAPSPSRDGRTYAFTLRPGLRFSDGTPVRPQDFRASIERLLRVTRDALPPFYDGIPGARACVARPDDCDLSRGIETDEEARTITIHLRRADAQFLHKLTMIFAALVPADTPVRMVRHGTPPLGTGPYRVASWNPDRGGVLTRNPFFTGTRPSGFADRIEVRVRGKRSVGAQIDDVLHGRSDVAVVADPYESFVKPARLRALRAQAPGRLHSFAGGSTNWMFLNVRERPFDDPDVRRAVNLAADRAHLVELGGGPDLATATCQFVPSGFPGYDPYCPYTASGSGGGWSAPDIATARELIARSGRAGARVTVWTPEFQRRVGRYFAGLLKRLGLRASLRVLPESSYFFATLDARSRAQIGYLGWSLDYLNAASFIQQTFTCETVGRAMSPNASHFCSRGVDRLVARALDAGPSEAAQAWAVADRAVVDRAPAVPMTNRRAVILVSDRVGNVQWHMVWSTLLDQLWVR
jgi:ABC-type transport system substrate-binding protein/DNA-binding SARP family transcriptional activator/outer membrane protein assembly factor BamB